MSFMDRARPLQALGFRTFPLLPGKKTPAIEGWQLNNYSVETIYEGIPENCNVGVYTGYYPGGSLVVVDIDNKGNKNGDETILNLALEGFVLPETYTVLTPTGGRHLYYRVDKPLRNSVGRLGPGIDTRSGGGYVVGAGSVVPAGEYRAVPHDVVDAPGWLVDRCGAAREPKAPSSEGYSDKVDQGSAKNRAIHYLEHEAPQAIEGQGGDHTTFKVAAHVKDIGVKEEKALELLLGHWNERNSPPWEATDLAGKVRNAYRYGERQVGSASPEAAFDPIPQELPGATEHSFLEEINKTHALIYLEGSHFIMHETVEENGAPKRVYLTETAFRRKFSPEVVVTDGNKARTQGDLWLNWKGRREYAGVCFAPERAERNGYYNLWRGFTCKPTVSGEASSQANEGFRLFMEHTLENVCAGDAELHRWLMGYFAHLVQRPFERPLTTLVFRGKKGVGKNAAIDRVGHLLGRSHYLVAHDGRYLTSNFNGHLDSCLVLVLDEAFWSGDKNAEGKLKGISTAPTILIERKGKEPYTVDNLVRLVVIGNEDWLVPASADERRYAVFDVGAGKMQQNEYFERMRVLMDSKGGCEVLLHYLQHFDLGTVDINRAPKTEGLLEQKIASLDLFHEWWFACLKHGEIQGLDFGEGWPGTVDKSSVRKAFIAYKTERQSKGWAHSEFTIGKLLRQALPSLSTGAKRREGERTINCYKLPPLEACRSEWAKFIGHDIDWEKDQ